MEIGVGVGVGVLGVLLSLRVSSSSSCYLYLLVGSGGRLNSSENEEWGGLLFLQYEGGDSRSLGVDLLENELEESDYPE